MSRGLGVVQRRVLEALRAAPAWSQAEIYPPLAHASPARFIVGAPTLHLEELKAALYGRQQPRLPIYEQVTRTGRPPPLFITRTQAGNLNRAIDALARRGLIRADAYGFDAVSRPKRFLQLLAEGAA